MNEKVFFAAGAVSGFLSVALGAFGAHGLRAKLTPEMLAIFKTGVEYQMFHALALFAVAWAVTHFHPGCSKAAGLFFILGSVIFSGSLYILAISGVRTWGAVTPLGGLFFLAGWVMLSLSVFRR